jgi:glycine cleavage system H protein
VNAPADRRYSRSHVWAMAAEPGVVVAGLTHVPGMFLGDVVSVELPPVQTEISGGEPIGLVQSSSTVFELLAPLSGTVVACNPEVESVPRKVTKDPYGDGWLLSIRPSDPEEMTALLESTEYERFAGVG